MKQSSAALGFWSSFIAFLSAAAYSISQIISPPLLPILKYPWNEILIIAPSLVLAVVFVIVMNCVHEYAANDNKIWSRIGLSFAVMYALFVGFAYIIQLATVIPATLRGEGNEVLFLALTKAHWIQAVDGLGYSLMSLATLFTYPVFAERGFDRGVRRFFLAHGLLAPFVVLPLWVPPLIVIGTLWFITGPGLLLFLTLLFRKTMKYTR
jgi:hypothetical protein